MSYLDPSFHVLLKGLFQKILGVDSSPVMIETARKTYPDIDFQLCDVSARLDELPADFDVVFSNACIQWAGCADADEL